MVNKYDKEFTIEEHKKFIIKRIRGDKYKGYDGIDITLQICNEKPKKGEQAYFHLDDKFYERVKDLVEWATNKWGSENVSYDLDQHSIDKNCCGNILTINNIKKIPVSSL